jgi:hypothetical protein
MGRPRTVILSNENSALGCIQGLANAHQQYYVKPQEENDSQDCDAVTTVKLLKQLDENHFSCGLTGEPLTTSTASLDHRVPLSRGGQHVMRNVHFVHKVINRMKGTMTEHEFIEWCTKVAEAARGRVRGPSER